MNYTMPAEWIEHEKTWISWPVKSSMIWPANHEEICRSYGEVVCAIAEFEPVTVLINERMPQQEILEEMEKTNYPITFLKIPHDDAWIRDNGPTVLKLVGEKESGHRLAVSWSFNAWGKKHPNYDLDDQLAQVLAEKEGLDCSCEDIVLEGGSIHVDGEGTLLTTKECLLNPNRNPSLNQESIEKRLKERLNIKKIIWLDQGLYGDETDGHVDNVACFVEPGHIVMQVTSDRSDPNYERSQRNISLLEKIKDAKERPIKLTTIEAPPLRFYKGERLTLSYLNFYLVNGGLILPIFKGDAEKSDQAAIEKLKLLFPKRRIRTVDGIPIIKEGGNVHCITQQLPR